MHAHVCLLMVQVEFMRQAVGPWYFVVSGKRTYEIKSTIQLINYASVPVLATKVQKQTASFV